MKRMKITIEQDGNYDLDLGEGFSGVSCIEKSKEIELILGGTETDAKTKDSYYDEGDTNVNELFLDK